MLQSNPSVTNRSLRRALFGNRCQLRFCGFSGFDSRFRSSQCPASFFDYLCSW